MIQLIQIIQIGGRNTFLINLQGKDSIYEQIKGQIEKFITSGIMKPDEKLPSVRYLANDLGVNPNTVMKAYQELEKNGYIYTVNKKGVFVSKDIKKHKIAHQDTMIKMLRALKAEGYSKQDIIDSLDEIYEEATKC